MLTALEEAPMNATLSPAVPTQTFEADAISSGIKISTRNTTSPVRYMLYNCEHIRNSAVDRDHQLCCSGWEQC